MNFNVEALFFAMAVSLFPAFLEKDLYPTVPSQDEHIRGTPEYQPKKDLFVSMCVSGQFEKCRLPKFLESLFFTVC